MLDKKMYFLIYHSLKKDVIIIIIIVQIFIQILAKFMKYIRIFTSQQPENFWKLGKFLTILLVRRTVWKRMVLDSLSHISF